MRTPSKSFILIVICASVVIGIYFLAPDLADIGRGGKPVVPKVRTIAHDHHDELDGPAGLEGAWIWVKSQEGAGEWIEKDTSVLLEAKLITRTHFIYFNVNPESKNVLAGASGYGTIKGNAYKETYTCYLTEGARAALGQEIDYTWHFEGEELHMAWSDGTRENKQVWRRLPKIIPWNPAEATDGP